MNTKSILKIETAFRLLGKTLYIAYMLRKKGTLEHWVRELALSETFKKTLDLSTFYYDKGATELYREYCREIGVLEPSSDTSIRMETEFKIVMGVAIIAYNKLYYSSKYYNLSINDMIKIFDKLEIWRKVCGSVRILGYSEAKVVLGFSLDEEIEQAIQNGE